MARSTWLLILIKYIYIYFTWLEELHFACYIIFNESSMPYYFTSNGYNCELPQHEVPVYAQSMLPDFGNGRVLRVQQHRKVL